MDLEKQIEEFLENHKKTISEETISAKEFTNIFMLGFISQIQKDILQFFNFKLIDTDDDNCIIECSLKQDNITQCHILKEFFLKENLPIIKNMFGLPMEVSLEDVGSGIVEIKNNDK